MNFRAIPVMVPSCLVLAACLVANARESGSDAVARQESSRQWEDVHRLEGHFTTQLSREEEQPMEPQGAGVTMSVRITLQTSATGTVDLILLEGPEYEAGGFWEGEGRVQASYTRLEVSTIDLGSGQAFTAFTERTGTASGQGLANIFLDREYGTYSVAFEPYPIEVEVREWVEFPEGVEEELRQKCESDLGFMFCMFLGMTTERTSQATEPVPAGYVNDIPLSSTGSSLAGNETLDDSTVFSWSLAAPCNALETVRLSIGWPLTDLELTFDGLGDGKLGIPAVATAEPQDAESSIQWSFPDIGVSRPRYTPSNARGPQIDVDYDRMPESNSEFGPREVMASTPESECVESAPVVQEPIFFFDLYGTGNPDGTVPNWLYYWLQTPAGWGLELHSQVKYAAECPSDDGRILGKFLGWAAPLTSSDHIYLCLGVEESTENPVTGVVSEGIDSFAATVLHEWTHKRHFDAWYTPDFFDRRDEIDADEDLVPDSLEGKGDAPMNLIVAGNSDSCNIKQTDEECITWWAERFWTAGSADEEDWANPGKQSGN